LTRRLADVTFTTVRRVTIAHVTGDIDASNAPRLQTIILEHTDNQDTGLVVDLSDLTYIDSTGIRLLYEISLRLDHRGQILRVALPPDSPIRRILAITKLDTLVNVDNTAQQAAAALTPPD
jgi:anti-anti-sigma factor